MKKISLNTMLIMLALVPLILAVVIISVATSGIMIRNLKQNTKEELIVAAKALKEYYEYDILNDNDLVDGFIRYDTNYIDSMHSTGVDLTLFKGNIRFMTTIKDNNGKRIEGTPASEAGGKGEGAHDCHRQDIHQRRRPGKTGHRACKGEEGLRQAPDHQGKGHSPRNGAGRMTTAYGKETPKPTEGTCPDPPSGTYAGASNH